MNIIGLLGKAGSGKDTAADVLVAAHGFVKVSMADPLKRICKDVFAFTDEQLWGPSEERNKPDERYQRPYRVRTDVDEHETRYEGLTPRYALQKLGTEWGRDCYSNIWVDYALRTARRLLEQKDAQEKDDYVTYDAKSGVRELHKLPRDARLPEFQTRQYDGDVPKGIVIPDVRFQNEVDAIRAAGGVIWKLVRSSAGLEGAAGEHASEKEMDLISATLFSRVLHNSSSLDMFKLQVARAYDEQTGRIRPYSIAQADIPPFLRK